MVHSPPVLHVLEHSVKWAPLGIVTYTRDIMPLSCLIKNPSTGIRRLALKGGFELTLSRGQMSSRSLVSPVTAPGWNMADKNTGDISD